MRKVLNITLLFCVMNAPAFSSIQFISAPLTPASGADTVLWVQLGLSTPLSQSFNATSANSLAVHGVFANVSGGTTCEVLGSSCFWPQAAGFSLNESLLWAENAAGLGSGPLTLTFLPQYGGGAYIQSAGDLQFTGRLKAFNGSTLLGSNTVTSDAQGSPIFLGVLASTLQVTGLEFSMTSCNSTGGACDATDFAIGTATIFSSTSSPTPEPASMLLALGGLAALALARAKQKIINHQWRTKGCI